MNEDIKNILLEIKCLIANQNDLSNRSMIENLQNIILDMDERLISLEVMLSDIIKNNNNIDYE